MRLIGIEMVEAGEDQWSFMVPLACPTPKAESRVTRNKKSHDLWGNLHHIPEPGKTEVMQFFLIQKGWLSLQDPPETQINIESIMFKILQSQTPSLKPVWVVNALQNCTKNIQTTKNLTIV